MNKVDENLVVKRNVPSEHRPDRLYQLRLILGPQLMLHPSSNSRDHTENFQGERRYVHLCPKERIDRTDNKTPSLTVVGIT